MNDAAAANDQSSGSTSRRRGVGVAAVLALTLLFAKPLFAAPPITAAAFAPNGNRVVVGSQAGIKILSWPELTHVADIATELRHVHDLAFSPNGAVLLAAGGAPADEGQVAWIDWSTGQVVSTIGGHDDLVYAVCWSPDGETWASASADCSVLVRRGRDAPPTLALTGHSRPVLAAVFLPDGRSLATAGDDQSLRLWDAVEGQPLRTLAQHTATVVDLAVEPSPADSRRTRIASASTDRTVRIWQPSIGRMVRFARLASPPLCVEWSADGRFVVAGCADGHVCMVDTATASVVAESRVLADGWVHTIGRCPNDGAFVIGGAEGRVMRFAPPDFAGEKQ